MITPLMLTLAQRSTFSPPPGWNHSVVFSPTIAMLAARESSSPSPRANRTPVFLGSAKEGTWAATAASSCCCSREPLSCEPLSCATVPACKAKASHRSAIDARPPNGHGVQKLCG